MATYRITWFFEGYQQAAGEGQSMNYGWTESWYLTIDGNLDTALAYAARGTAGFWIALRRRFLHRIYNITAVRAVDVANPLRTKTVFVHFPGQSGVIANLNDGNRHAVGYPAQVTCALLVDFTRLPTGETEQSHHKRMLFRGLTNGAINGNVMGTDLDYVAPIYAFMDYVGGFRASLLTTGNVPAPHNPPVWLMRYRNPAAAAYEPITVLTPVVGNQRQINITAALGGLNFGDKLRIKGVREPRGANRVWTVMESAIGPPYRLGTARLEVAGTYDVNGKVAPVDYVYNPATQYNIVGMRSRRTGRPFSRTRGRSSFRG